MASAKTEPKTGKKPAKTAKPVGEGTAVGVALNQTAPVAPADTVDDLFANLTNSATKEGDAKASKDDRDTITLTGADAEVMDRFCQSKVWLDKTKGINEAAKADLDPILGRTVATKMVQVGHRIANPRFVTSSSKVLYQVKNQIKVKLPVTEEGKQVSVLDFFLNCGVPKERAAAIAALFTRKTILTVVPITDIKESNPALAEKIMRSLTGLSPTEVQEVAGALAYNPVLAAKVSELVSGLSANERKDALRVASEVKTVATEEETLSQMAKICKTPQELSLVMDAANVTTAVSSATYDGDLMEAGKTLMNFDPKKQAALFTVDKSYRFEAKGKQAIVYRGDSDAVVLTKECTDAGHARSTCTKWQREPAYLAKSLADHLGK